MQYYACMWDTSTRAETLRGAACAPLSQRSGLWDAVGGKSLRRARIGFYSAKRQAPATGAEATDGRNRECSMPASRDDLMDYLDSLGIAATTVDHPPVFTVEEAQALRGTIAGAHSKNLFLKDKKGALFLVVAREDAAIDLKRLHGRIGASGRLSFGQAELLVDRLGVTPGSVTPFGLINDRPPRVRVILEAALVAAGTVNFHPLENTATTTLASSDLIAFIRATGHEPEIVDLTPGDPAS